MLCELYTELVNVFVEKTSRIVLPAFNGKRTSFLQLNNLDATDGDLYNHLKKLTQSMYFNDIKEIPGDKVPTIHVSTAVGKKPFKDYLLYFELQVKGVTQ